MVLRLLLGLLIFVSSMTSAWSCDNKLLCIGEESLSVGVAFGIGVRTNPLVDGDAIPLVVLPDVAWYSDTYYFDNGEFGLQWRPYSDITTETFIRTNAEAAYFSFWHPNNFLVPVNSSTSGDTPPTPGDQDEPNYISVDDIASRNWTVDAGIRIRLPRDEGRWSFSAIHDALGVYNGYSLRAGYSHDFFYKDWTFSTNLSVTYKSKNLIDYYYGISERDTDNESLWYQASHSVQITTGFFLTKKITPNWYWLGRFHITTLGSGMSDSPLVSKSHVSNAFIGIGYRF